MTTTQDIQRKMTRMQDFVVHAACPQWSGTGCIATSVPWIEWVSCPVPVLRTKGRASPTRQPHRQHRLVSWRRPSRLLRVPGPATTLLLQPILQVSLNFCSVNEFRYVDFQIISAQRGAVSKRQVTFRSGGSNAEEESYSRVKDHKGSSRFGTKRRDSPCKFYNSYV